MKNLTFTEYAVKGIQSLKNLENQDYIKDFENQLDRIRYYGEKAGQALEYKYGRDLRGYYKIYFADQSWRIVYKETDKEFELIEIILVGPRDSVYKMADIIINGKWLY